MTDERMKMGYALQWTQYEPTSLLAAVLENYHHWTEDEACHALTSGLVTVNGVETLTDCALLPADKVVLTLTQHSELVVDTRWKLIWKTPELMVVHKPAGLPVSRTTRNLFDTLISQVRRATEYKHAHLLHRLDAETSGLIILANYDHADRKWKKRIDRLIERKIYHALVWGVPDWQETLCECYLAEKKDSPIRTQMHVVAEDESDTVKAPKLARTRFKCEKIADGFSLISCELLSGRKHQIRAQLAHLGLPIIGDKIYSHDGRFYLQRLAAPLTAEDYAVLGAEHHLLHAFQLNLNTGKDQAELQDPLFPDAWQPYLQQF
jgi:23S rRNA pseudouridine1911/1915/1917 synthase